VPTRVPTLCEVLTLALGPTSPLSPDDKALLANVLDPNKDNVISESELRASPVWALFKPDVDTDGDGKPDGYSMAVAFTAVPCSIKR
jgi:hypothetical protein